jgi:hypothetical protein
MRASGWLLSALILSCHPALGSGVKPPPQEALVLDHATVIDVTNGSLLSDRSFVIAGGRITAVGRSSDVSAPAGARVVDATGKFAIPGLWDMHVHFLVKSHGALFVANGVTGVRVMWGNPTDDETSALSNLHSQWRTEFDEGEATGPRMVIASGLMDGPNPVWPGSVVVKNAAEGREAVRAAKKAGADFVKVYELLSPEAYFAIAEKGVPAIFTEGASRITGKPRDYGRKKVDEYLERDYHKVSDEVKKDWNLDGALDDARLLLELGYRVARDEEYPEWKPGTEFRARREKMLGH